MRTEKVFASIFLVGLIFKLLHWPGAGVLIVISLSTLAFFYFPLAFYFFCDKQIKRQNLALSIISGFFLSIIPIGVMFKLQYWPGAQVQLLAGLFTAPIIFVVVYFLQKKSSEDLVLYYKNMFNRTLLLSILTMALYFTPTSTLIKIQHWDDAELARLKTQHFANPDNEEYAREYNKYIKRDTIEYNETE